MCPSIHIHIPVTWVCQDVLWCTVHSEQQSFKKHEVLLWAFLVCISWTGYGSGVTVPLAEHPELHLMGGIFSLFSQKTVWVRAEGTAKAILYQAHFILLDFYSHISSTALSGRRQSLPKSLGVCPSLKCAVTGTLASLLSLIVSFEWCDPKWVQLQSFIFKVTGALFCVFEVFC